MERRLFQLLTRTLYAFRIDLGLGALAWLALIGMTRPASFSALVRWSKFDDEIAFNTATLTAFLAFSWLTFRFVVRLVRNGRKMRWDPETRAVSGTVMAEFALVLPIVLLLVGTVIQISLIANAVLVVRYAAFAAARSAIVSFEADMGRDLLSSPGASLTSMFQMPPFPELVDKERPINAAAGVLASISPRGNFVFPQDTFMQEVLTENGDVWDEGNFAERVAYARGATTLTTIFDKFDSDLAAWRDSFSPLIPIPEHVVQPARQKESGVTTAYLLPEPPPLKDLFPDSIPFEIPIKSLLPPEVGFIVDQLGVKPIVIDIPLEKPKELLSPALESIDSLLDGIRTGTAAGISDAARSENNIDPFGPKEVEITLVYLFRLTIPSLIQLAPGVAEPDPQGSAQVFRIQHPEFFTVRLQSTGGRRGLLNIFPFPIDFKGSFESLFEVKTTSDDDLIDGKDFKAKSGRELKISKNTPLYFRLRDDDDDDDDDKKKKKKDAEKKAKDKEKDNDKKKDSAEDDQKKKNDKKKKDDADSKKKLGGTLKKKGFGLLKKLKN